ncbi:PREDICTED: uncharacterized protein LOC107194248 [Dufourea novaeangliae]|uniref:Uncharacterized protein n=1 Tax=Dufourea novaeangliae TaxID=178035 RepID=A0A154P2E0_DUFNO|nr:PREDICTED: uncharacterized protein LOC107194248 [Dufourea novaeangliae]KZC06003.1 hypothetical protein WN55_06178 [Dufourea novaeangliae]
MSIGREANKWTPKLIIVFQLTIWTVVGLIFLRKGANSLCDIKDTIRNDTADTQETIVRWNEKQSIQESSIIKNRHRIAEYEVTTWRKDVVALDSSKKTAGNGKWLSRKPYISYRLDNIGRRIPEKSSTNRKLTTNDDVQDTRGIRAIPGRTITASNRNKDEKIDHKESAVVVTFDQSSYNVKKVLIDNDASSSSFQLENSSSVNVVTSDDRDLFEIDEYDTRYKATRIDRIEKKLRRTPVNRVGAAAAITMLAIGVVMLLLGPLIIILRAFGDRRRSRQIFLKSRCHADRPPTYEEAVLMDQAPRYSTLQLDTIPESSFFL